MRLILTLCASLTLIAGAMAQTASRPPEVAGLTTVPSASNAAATTDKLEAAIRAKGLKVFTRIDHAAAAREAGLDMPAATVVVFGAPKAGTPVFLKTPTLAIDLPLKALVWNDAGGKTFVSYNNGAYINGVIFPRHGINPPAEAAGGQEALLAGIVAEATR